MQPKKQTKREKSPPVKIGFPFTTERELGGGGKKGKLLKGHGSKEQGWEGGGCGGKEEDRVSWADEFGVKKWACI